MRTIVLKVFCVLIFEFRKLPVTEIRTEALILCKVYSQDISDDLVEEILHLKEYFELEDQKHLNNSFVENNPTNYLHCV